MRPPSSGDHGVDGGGHDHAADGRRDRQCRLARRRQFAGKRLTLDLQADQQEEDGHQAVVDPLVKGERQPMPTTGDGDWRRPETMIGVRPWRIGHRERGARTDDEQRSGGCFSSEEFLERTRCGGVLRLGHHSHTVPQVTKCLNTAFDLSEGDVSLLFGRMAAGRVATDTSTRP